MKKTTSTLWVITVLFISIFIYVSTFDTQTTKEGLDFIKFFIAFFAFVSVILTIFDNIDARKTIRHSKSRGFYSILLLSLLTFSSCTEIVGNGILIEPVKEENLTQENFKQSKFLFGKYTYWSAFVESGDTIHVVLPDYINKKSGDIVVISKQGSSFLTVE